MGLYRKDLVLMRVIVDLDQVLNKMHHTWIAAHNRGCTKCSPKSVADIKQWYFDKDFECGTDVYSYLNSAPLYMNAPVMEDAIYGTLALQEMGLDLYIATHSFGDESIRGKHAFMENNFPHIPLDKVIHIKNKSLLNFDFIIDDCPDHMRVAATSVGMLFDHVYNREENLSPEHLMIIKTYNPVRVFGWRDIVEKFKVWTQ